MEWVDSHCHLGSLAEDADEVLAQARAAGVVGFVCVGTDLESSRLAVGLAARHADVRATVGLHPHDASRLEAEWPALVSLAGAPEVAGVGEAGFDLYYRHSSVEEQEAAFRAHVRLAHELDTTLVIHTRDAWAETFAVLDDERAPRRTVFHCFTGGAREAERALALGASLSFSGIVSFKHADDVRAAARVTPLDRALVETDSPYLAPVPHRGKENRPAWVPAVGAALADAMGVPQADLAAATARNAATLFAF